MSQDMSQEMFYGSSTAAIPSVQTHNGHPTGWPTEEERFADRAEAGRALSKVIATHLCPHAGKRPLVLGLTKGGVVVGREIATHLNADFDVLVAMKVGLPWKPSYRVGAIADGGPPVFDHGALAGARVSLSGVTPSVRLQRMELRRRQYRFRGNRPAPNIANRDIIITDDGLTPSLVARAAIRAIRAGDPASITFASPVCAAESVDWLTTEADSIVCLRSPRVFHALGLWYKDFSPVTDDDVTQILTMAWENASSTPVG